MNDKKQIEAARRELQRRMLYYLNRPQHPSDPPEQIAEELRAMQEVYRAQWFLRNMLAAGLFACQCGSVEGEVHASECVCSMSHIGPEPLVVTRPEGWTPSPAGVPVEIREHVDKPCEKASEGCIYNALPGTKRCAMHTEVT